MPGGPARWLRAARVVHPFPSALNAFVVLGLAAIAGAPVLRAFGLAAAMLGLQFCIGAVNDLCDEELDARTKPRKPIPAGFVTRRTAVAVALAAGGGGLTVAALYGAPVLAMAMVMLGAGLAYDVTLKRGPWSWVAYSVALPVLPLYAWWGAVGRPPPGYELLLPLAVLSGPALQLANSLVDFQRDRAAGVRSLAAVVGPVRSLALVAAIQAMIHGLAWWSLASTVDGAAPLVLAGLGASGLLGLAGVVSSGSPAEPTRERGWRLQALSIGLLAVAWLSSAAASRA